MRPIRLEMQGFTSFRELTTVDFEGSDYFAFVGPTGSGKSSIIDAITFALYGSVPRYDDKRLVAPVITQGQLEARVSLDFAVGDDFYRVARVVRRTGSGASTKEARLEREDEVLAGDADSVTLQVQRLLGLTFEHFIKCVALPQGDFARLLHDKPSDRQALLVRLLDLGVYETMRKRANQQASEAAMKAELVTQQIEEIGELDDAAEVAARERVTQLEDLRKHLEEEQPRMDELKLQVNEARTAAQAATSQLEVLRSVKKPDGTASAAREQKDAEKALTRAAEDVKRAITVVNEARVTSRSMPDRSKVEAAITAHEQRAKVEQQRKSVDAACNRKEAAARKLHRALETAEQAQREAIERLESVKYEFSALELSRGLGPGDECPVCRRPLEEEPPVVERSELDKSVAKAEAAKHAVEQRRKESAEAEKELAAARAEAKTLANHVAELDALVKTFPSVDSTRMTLGQIEAVERRLNNALEAMEKAQAAQQKAEDRRARALQIEAEARQIFEQARDAVAELKPPPATRSDLVSDWGALENWARQQIHAIELRREAAEKTAAEAADAGKALVEDLCERCGEAGFEVTNRFRPLDDCSQALADARAALSKIEKDRLTVAKLNVARESSSREHQVASALAQHLSAKGFEKWLLDEAFQRLVIGGSTVLKDLSQGQYSIDFDQTGNFTVIDHRNADEQRPARTLSGGETFLASLALALALADEIAGLASEGAARLDAIFLDEGFGTLDADALDTVAAAIETLTARGRVVGIVTHVRELAERVPVRYEVRKDISTSTVDRVVA